MKKEDFYEEGGQVDYQQLMDWALNKYKTRKESEQWCQRTTEEETIIALQAQVKTLMSKKSDANSKSGGKKDQKKATKKGKGKGKLKPEDRPAWMKTPPRMEKSSPRLWMARNTIGVQTMRAGQGTSHQNAKALSSPKVKQRRMRTSLPIPSPR